MVSTAALVTPSAVRASVSRPTMRPTALRAAGRSSFTSFRYTTMLSFRRSWAARHWLQRKISAKRASQGETALQSQRTAHPAQKLPAGSTTAAARSPPGVGGKHRRRRLSSFPMAQPIPRTGWGSHRGSPMQRSRPKASSITRAVFIPHPPSPAQSPEEPWRALSAASLQAPAATRRSRGPTTGCTPFGGRPGAGRAP